MTLIFLIFTCLLLPVPVFAAVFSPQVFTLANGVRLVVVENDLSPAVAHMMWVQVGAADEEPGRTGLAHYLEHMMFKGTKNVPSGQFHKLIARRGGQENAFTTHDVTAFHEIVPAKDLALVMHLNADRLRHLAPTAQEALRERSVVASERQERTDNDPKGQFSERLRAALFPGHPYGRPIIGWKADIERLNVEDYEAFYNNYYLPKNIVIAVSGPIKAQQVAGLAAATYGRLSAEPEGRRVMALPPSMPPKEKRVLMEDKRITHPVLVRNYVVPSSTMNPKEADILEVLAEVLGGGEVGLLYRHFVVEARIANAARMSYDGVARGPALMGISLVPTHNMTPEQLEQGLETYLRQLAKRGLSGREVDAAKRRMIDSAVFARDSLMAPAYALGQVLAVGLSVDVIETWPQRIADVRVRDVNRALRDLANSSHYVTGILRPEANNP